MIGIRVDANNEIAMGHLMRCMSIATCLELLGEELVFIMSQSYGSDFLEDKGFSYIVLENMYQEKLGELGKLTQVLQENHIDILLVDSYQVNIAYMNQLKDVVKLVYLDDLVAECYPVEKVFNYAPKASAMAYQTLGYVKRQLCLGEQYTPLRHEFTDNAITVKEKVENIYLSTGGTDSFHMIVALLEVLSQSEFKNIRKTVVAGNFFQDDELVNKMIGQGENIIFMKNVKDVASVMRTCDVAISAGGTTLAELAACGVPTICFSIADNQLESVKAYSERGVLIYAGDVRNNRDALLKQIVSALENLLEDKELRVKFSEMGRKMIDGKGAMRIAEEICKLHNVLC